MNVPGLRPRARRRQVVVGVCVIVACLLWVPATLRADGDGEVRPGQVPPAQEADDTRPVGATVEETFRTSLPAVWSTARAADWPDLEWKAAGRTNTGIEGRITVPEGHVLGIVLRADCTGEQLAQLKLIRAKNVIHRVSLARLAVYDEALSVLKELDGLRELDVSGCRNLTTNACGYIGSLRKLRRLTMASSRWVSRAGMGELQKLNRLIELSVSDCRLVDDGMMKMLEKMPELQVLDVSGCEMLGDATLQVIGTLRDLRDLRMYGVRSISDTGLQQLAPLVNLQSLALGPVTRATDRGLAVVRQLVALKVLMLEDGRRFTDDGLAPIGNLGKLDTLSLKGATRLTDIGVIKHLSAMPNLKLIDLRGCTGVTKDGAKKLQDAGADRWVSR